MQVQFDTPFDLHMKQDHWIPPPPPDLPGRKLQYLPVFHSKAGALGAFFAGPTTHTGGFCC